MQREITERCASRNPVDIDPSLFIVSNQIGSVNVHFEASYIF